MINILDNDDYFFKKSELTKEKSLLELAFSVGFLYKYQFKDMNFLNSGMMKIKKNLKIKFKNADEKVFKNFVRIYLHTICQLDDLWVCNEYGYEFPI